MSESSEVCQMMMCVGFEKFFSDYFMLHFIQVYMTNIYKTQYSSRMTRNISSEATKQSLILVMYVESDKQQKLTDKTQLYRLLKFYKFAKKKIRQRFKLKERQTFRV